MGVSWNQVPHCNFLAQAVASKKKEGGTIYVYLCTYMEPYMYLYGTYVVSDPNIRSHVPHF